MKNDLRDYSLRIDGPLLAGQRELLLKVVDKVHRGEPYRPESSGDQELLQGVIVLLDEIADQAHDRYGIDSLIKPDGSNDTADGNEERCECEEPGYFCSGVPGILAHIEDGILAEGAKVERCDICCRYSSDAAALERLANKQSETDRKGDSHDV